MREKTEYRVGVGASSILMMLVVLALAALSLLSLSGAKNNATLSQRNLTMTLAYYEAAATVQRELGAMDTVMAENAGRVTDAEAWGRLFAQNGIESVTVARDMTFTLNADAGAGRALKAEGRLNPGGSPRYTLTRHELYGSAATEEAPINLLQP